MSRIICLAAAVLIVALLPLYEKKLDVCLEALRSKLSLSAAGVDKTAEISEEDDILSNKNKWKLLIIGYCVFIIFMLLATLSIVTLNTKINNISAATEDILDRLSDLETND